MLIEFDTDPRGLWMATHGSNGAILATGRTREICKSALRRTIHEQIGFGPLYDSAPRLREALEKCVYWSKRGAPIPSERTQADRDRTTIFNVLVDTATVSAPQPENAKAANVADPITRQISDNRYRAAAQFLHHNEGTVEIDDQAPASWGNDGGAYVQAWIWISDDAVEIFENSQ